MTWWVLSPIVVRVLPTRMCVVYSPSLVPHRHSIVGRLMQDGQSSVMWRVSKTSIASYRLGLSVHAVLTNTRSRRWTNWVRWPCKSTETGRTSSLPVSSTSPAAVLPRDSNGHWDLLAEVRASSPTEVSKILERVRLIRTSRHTQASIPPKAHR